MKTAFIALLVSFLAVPALAQSDSTANPLKNDPTFQRYVKIYAMARAYGDIESEKSALYHLVAMNPSNPTLRDSLALVFYQQGKNASAALVCSETLSYTPDNQFARELRGLAYENLGLFQKALADFESIYLKTDDLNTLYKITILQFQANSYNEAMTNADILLKKDGLEDLSIVFGLRNGGQQEVPMRASIYNIKGAISESKEDIEAAIANYKLAVGVFPDFELAKDNLNRLQAE